MSNERVTNMSIQDTMYVNCHLRMKRKHEPVDHAHLKVGTAPQRAEIQYALWLTLRLHYVIANFEPRLTGTCGTASPLWDVPRTATPGKRGTKIQRPSSLRPRLRKLTNLVCSPSHYPAFRPRATCASCSHMNIIVRENSNLPNCFF